MVLRTALRAGLVATLGAALIAVTPTPTSAHTVVAPAQETLVAATAAVHRAAATAVLVVRVVSGQTSWGLAARYCGRGAAHEDGVTVRSPRGSVRAPAAIWPGDWATVSCARAATPTRAASSSGWVAPLAGALHVYGDCRVGGKGGHFLAQRPGHLHQGVDFGRNTGTTIRASFGGVVSYAGWDDGAGWMVRIVHSTGRAGAITKYFHMVRRPIVVTGQRVITGQPLGYVGNTGASFEPHLHLETWQYLTSRAHPHGAWTAVNPSPFLRARGIAVGGC